MPHNKKTAGIILAAGMSQRFGRPKQLLKLGDRCMLERVLDSALASRLAKIVLVLGHDYQKITAALKSNTDQPRLQVVINRRYREGQSTSLQAGLSVVYSEFQSVMFLLGDQPRLSSGIIDQLLEGFWGSQKYICVPVYRGIRGNPTIFSRAMYCHLMALKGDIGGRQIIQARPGRVLQVEVDDPLCFWDIDTPQDHDNYQRIS